MDKEGGPADSERPDGAALLEVARNLDPGNLFAYWPRGDSGTSAATNALYGAYGRGNPTHSSSRNHPPRPNINVNHGMYGQAPVGFPGQTHGMGSASSAMWWNACNQSATYEYMRRLQQIGANGWPGPDPNLLPNLFPMPMHPSLSPAMRSHMTATSSQAEKEKEAERERAKERERERERELRERERERERELREREKEREREREKQREKERERERERVRDMAFNRIPVIAHSGSKTDHLASIAALANTGISVSSVPPRAHSTASGSVGILGGVRLPPDTDIIKFTSSIIGPKVPGTTNRGRKKTISLDPPRLSAVPTHSSTGIPIVTSQMDKNCIPDVAIKNVGAGQPRNESSFADEDAPLNLCTKPRISDATSDRISRRKLTPKQRRAPSTDTNPILSLSAMSQQYASIDSSASALPVATTSAATSSTTLLAEDESEPSSKDGRPRNLGRGVSKPKKNTVASLLAQSRALGLKGTLPGELASQLAALKPPMTGEAFTSHLALLHNLAAMAEEDPDRRVSTPESAAIEELKARLKSSEDGSFTTDSASTGGSDSESEHGTKHPKPKKDKSLERPSEKPHTATRPTDVAKSKPPKNVEEKDRKAQGGKDSALAQELLKQKDILHAVEVEKERRRQHMVLVKMLDARKKVEEREKKKVDVRIEKIAKQEKKMELKKKELELLKELKQPTEDMELTDLAELPNYPRICGLKEGGTAFGDTMLIFEFLHNFGETLGFDIDSLPTLNSLQGALLNDEEHEEELLSIMTHLLVCAIEDPGIPNPARHITMLGQSLKQADITHANLSEILRIYLYANATGEVKALTGLSFERDREKKISEHHNLYGEEAMVQSTGKNAAFFEHLYDNKTYKLSEELKEKPFLALNPTTKGQILAYLCDELLQNKAVLRRLEGSMDTVTVAKRERWSLDQSIRKLRVLYERHTRYMFNKNQDKDGMSQGNVAPPYKEKNAERGDSEEDDDDDFDHDPESSQLDEDVQNLNVEEVTKRLEKYYKQQEACNATIAKASQQIRTTCLGQDRFYRRYWCLPKAGAIYVEGMESAQPDVFWELESQDREVALPPTLEPAIQVEGLVPNEKKGSTNKGSGPPALEVGGPPETNDAIRKRTHSAPPSNGEKRSKLDDSQPRPVENIVVSQTDDIVEVQITPQEGSAKIPLVTSLIHELDGVKLTGSDGDDHTKEIIEPVSSTSGLGNKAVTEIVEVESATGMYKPSFVDFAVAGPSSSSQKWTSPKKTVEDKNGGTEKSFAVDLKTLSEKAAKSDEDDLLLRAMKNELTSRIFGATASPSSKKDTPEDPYLFRNTSSPLSNGDQFNFTLLGRARSLVSDLEAQSFSILPKESCDPASILFAKGADGEVHLLTAPFPKRGGLPPSPGPLPPSDNAAPLVLTPDEAFMLELIKTHGFPKTAVKRSVPADKRRGWWRISDQKTLKEVIGSLNGRGIRERELKKTLIRFAESTLETLTSMSIPNELTDLDDTPDSRIRFLADGAPAADLPRSWDETVAQRIQNSILEQVENLEDKVASASMQVKGWRVPSRSAEAEVQINKLPAVETAKQRLMSLESAIERRYLKPPLGFATGEGGIGIQVEQDESIPKGLSLWRDAVVKSHTAAQLAMSLYMLESCIAWDKSIMKANCQFCLSGDNEDKLLLCDGCDKGFHMYCFKPKLDAIPDGDWYCHECKNKVSGERNCIVCGKRMQKNYVLCEHCPRAYHSDCLNPPMLRAPRGKWNCNSCAIKFPKKKCGRKVGWRKSRESKHRDGHRDFSGEDKLSEKREDEKSDGETDGEDLPLSATCSSRGEKECVPLSPIPSTSFNNSNANINDYPPPLSPQALPPSLCKKDRISKKHFKDLTICKTIMEEMELQDEAWPFLLPVNTKQFPTYKKIIKSPMDLSTIKKRLNDETYKTKEEFVEDVRQIFNNCETFNEDDSPVGKAGHAMRSFFEMRWGEISGSKPAA